LKDILSDEHCVPCCENMYRAVQSPLSFRPMAHFGFLDDLFQLCLDRFNSKATLRPLCA
jgi:hypothetical protein